MHRIVRQRCRPAGQPSGRGEQTLPLLAMQRAKEAPPCSDSKKKKLLSGFPGFVDFPISNPTWVLPVAAQPVLALSRLLVPVGMPNFSPSTHTERANLKRAKCHPARPKVLGARRPNGGGEVGRRSDAHCSRPCTPQAPCCASLRTRQRASPASRHPKSLSWSSGFAALSPSLTSGFFNFFLSSSLTAKNRKLKEKKGGSKG